MPEDGRSAHQVIVTNLPTSHAHTHSHLTARRRAQTWVVVPDLEPLSMPEDGGPAHQVIVSPSELEEMFEGSECGKLQVGAD